MHTIAFIKKKHEKIDLALNPERKKEVISKILTPGMKMNELVGILPQGVELMHEESKFLKLFHSTIRGVQDKRAGQIRKNMLDKRDKVFDIVLR